jgi:hypothetical protein
MAAFILPQRRGGDSDRLMAVPAGELVRMMPLNNEHLIIGRHTYPPIVGDHERANLLETPRR